MPAITMPGDRPPMRIGVLGAGAMGILWAVRLGRAGASVVLLESSRDKVEVVQRDGLILEDRDGIRDQTRPQIALDPHGFGFMDALFVFVKAHHTRDAIQSAAPLIGDQTTVVTLQNGWGNAEVVARSVDRDQLVVGVTYHSSMVLSPGRIAHTGVGSTFVGPYRAGASLDRAAVIADIQSAAGLETSVTDSVLTEIWKKLVMVCCALPTAALTGLLMGELSVPGPMLDLIDSIATETVATARAQGLDIDLAERLAKVHNVLANGGVGKPSMLQDIEGRRKTEIDVINGAVVKAAREVGIDVPVNRALVALILGLERGRARPDES